MNGNRASEGECEPRSWGFARGPSFVCQTLVPYLAPQLSSGRRSARWDCGLGMTGSSAPAPQYQPAGQGVPGL